MRVKISSPDGLSHTTRVETEEGVEIKGISLYEWTCVAGGMATCKLTVNAVALETFAELEAVIPIISICAECKEELVPARWETEEGNWMKVHLCDCGALSPEEYDA